MTRLLQALCAIGIAVLASSLPPQAQAPTPIRVAYIPIANYAALQVARDKGYFAEEKLNVTWAPVAQGAVAVNVAIFAQIYTALFGPMQGAVNGITSALSGTVAGWVTAAVVCVLMIWAASMPPLFSASAISGYCKLI